jgi:hypothetical protein
LQCRAFRIAARPFDVLVQTLAGRLLDTAESAVVRKRGATGQTENADGGDKKFSATHRQQKSE